MKMATTVLGLKTFAASDPVDYNEINDNYNKIDNGVKTALQGRAAYNLLDNSNFADLVAQAGLNGAHGSTAYIADRWKSGNATATANSGYTTISSTEKEGRIVQMLSAAVAGKTVTAAAKVASANTIYFGVYYIQNSVSKYINNSFVSPNGVIMVSGAIPADATNIEFRIYTSYIDGGGSCNVYWATLYEGSYTADTLPAYQPKGYAAELAECMRYYRRFINSAPAMSTAATAIEVEMPLEPPMRVVPTITINSVGPAYTPEGTKSVSGSYSATNTVNKAGYVFYTPSIGIGLPCVITGIDGYLSADL